jgi:glycosyltransferase involved in cell wall biosynthesis
MTKPRSGPDTATVVITTHNRPALAIRAIASVLAQDVDEVFVVVVDDGSDPPFDPGDQDERVVLIRNDRPRGPSAARNQGIAVARGDWIAFLDDDDTLTPDMLSSSIETARSSSLPPPVSVLSGIAIVEPDGNVLNVRLPPTLPKGSHFFLEEVEGSFQTHNSLVVTLDVVRELGGFDESLPASEHDDFFLRLNEISSIEGLREVTYRMTAHEGTRLSKSVLARARGMELTLRRHEAVFRQHPRRHAHYLATMGVTYLRGGRWLPAVRATTRSLIVDPLRPKAWLWWLASLAGPWPLGIWRRMRQRRVG